MPITLTTPKSTGDLDPNAPDSEYAEVKITEMRVNLINKEIMLNTAYGNTVTSVWHGGILPPSYFVVRNELEEGHDYYDQMAEAVSLAADEVYYDKVSTMLYQWLIDQGHFIGTVT